MVLEEINRLLNAHLLFNHSLLKGKKIFQYKGIENSTSYTFAETPQIEVRNSAEIKPTVRV